MPICNVQTNLADSQLPGDFILQLSKVISETLKKPEERISVHLQTNVKMCRGGSEDPTMTINIWSIGVFDEQKNPTYGNGFYNFLEAATAIPTKRILLVFHPIEAYYVGART